MKALKFLLPSLLLLITSISYASPYSDAPAGELTVVQVSPAAHSLSALPTAAITIRFNRAVDPDTVHSGTFSAFGRWSGPVGGTYTFSNQDKDVTLTPAAPFSAGEIVMVVLSHDLMGADGSSLRSGGYAFQFWIRTRPTTGRFRPIQTLSTRTTPSQPTQAYGGVATDLNNDGWLDLTIINEITADVRVFLNQADGSGRFDDFIEPTFPVGDRASPSEASDFNKDGNADLVVVNIDDDTVSFLLGNGDGTFAPQNLRHVGNAPRGVAVLDVDGDGDADVVNTNSAGSGNLSLMLNDGSGIFGTPIFFEGGGTGEWAIAAADMNEDGILDLAVGNQSFSNPTITVLAGDGDGTFTLLSSQDAGGATWMINAADVNGDGHDDVVSANSTDNNGAVLFGDGAGNLAEPVLVQTDPFPLASDLGDVDGDGDLDWATSSFSGDWYLFINDGAGNFTLGREFPSAVAASCALMYDGDNDGDLDLALVDEIADEVIIVRNR